MNILSVTYLFVCGIIINFGVFAFSFKQSYHSEELNSKSQISLVVSKELLQIAKKRVLISTEARQELQGIINNVQSTQNADMNLINSNIHDTNLKDIDAVSADNDQEDFKLIPFTGSAELNNITMNGKSPLKKVNDILGSSC